MPTWRMPSPNRKRGPSGSRFASIDSEEVVDRFLLPSLAAEQLAAMIAQAEDVGGRVQPAELDELGDRLLAQPLDVERSARHEMPQPLEPLRRADQAAGAADVDLAFLGNRLALAFRAMVGEYVRLAAARRASDSRRPAGSRRRRAGCARGRRCAGRAAAISSRLWSVTLATITPPTPTGSAARPASACRCGRPGCRSLRASSRPSPRGICARGPSAARARRSPAVPASRAGRPCRRRRRYRTAGPRAPPRSRDIGASICRRYRRSGPADR